MCFAYYYIWTNIFQAYLAIQGNIFNERKTKSVQQHSRELPHLGILQKFRIIVSAAQKYSQRVEKQLGVTGAQLWIMKEIDVSPGLRVGEVAKKLAIHQTTASNLLDALEKKEMICKSRQETDQRIVNLTLTEKGRSLMQKAPEPVRGLLPEALSQMKGDDLIRLGESMDVLLHSIQQVDEEFAMQPLSFTNVKKPAGRPAGFCVMRV